MSTRPPCRRRSPKPLAAALIAACAAAPVFAQEADDGRGLPLWELGVLGFGTHQQAYPGADEHVRRGLVLPYVIYRGRILRADRETAGLRAVKTDRFELDVGFAGAFGAKAGDVDARRGMDDLGTLVEFGPRARWTLADTAGGGRWRFELPLRAVFDLGDRLAHRGWALEPTLRYDAPLPGGGRWGASVGALAADRRLADTFYRVRPSEALPDRPAYDASAGLVAWRLELRASAPLASDWRVFGFARLDTVGGATNRDSPLVRQTTGGSVGVGVAWTWLRSSRSAQD